MVLSSVSPARATEAIINNIEHAIGKRAFMGFLSWLNLATLVTAARTVGAGAKAGRQVASRTKNSSKIEDGHLAERGHAHGSVGRRRVVDDVDGWRREPSRPALLATPPRAVTRRRCLLVSSECAPR